MKAKLRIVDKIVGLAKSRGMTQGVLEQELKLPHGRITKWLGGNTEPGGSVCWAAAKLLAVDITYLLDPEAQGPALPAGDDFSLVNQLTKQLGAAESFRRLTTPNWQDRRGSDGSHEATYTHTKRVDEEPRRRRGTA